MSLARNQGKYLEDIIKQRVEDLQNETLSFPSYNINLREKCRAGNSYNTDLLSGRYVQTLLSETFFSDPNIKIIQNAIRAQVHARIGEVIAEQNETQLVLIMRWIFFQYARHQETCIREQVAELNDRVVAYVVPQILNEIKQYAIYIQDRYSAWKPPVYPEQATSYGSKQFELFQSM